MRTAVVRERIVSIVDLNDLFQWNRPGSVANGRTEGDVTLVIVGDEDREVGLAVDDLLGEEDIVIKSMAENYQNVQGIAGASILGDGRVSLILDPVTLIELSYGKGVVAVH
jgi:two-component system chemotaxis sensor kinase CheA